MSPTVLWKRNAQLSMPALDDQSSEWRRPGKGRPAGYVALTQRFADPMDESDWPTQFNWLRVKLERFDAVFRPIVGEL